jgi:hypothetical protein
MSDRIELTEELLREEYIVNKLTAAEIAKKYGYCRDSVLGHLRKFNIEIRTKSRGPKNCQWTGTKHISTRYFNTRISSIKKDKNFDSNADINYAEEVYVKQNGKCAFSDIELTPATTHKDDTASLDRIDNNKGYDVGNIQWVHKEINDMRGILPPPRFKHLCTLVSDKTKRDEQI